MDDFTAAARALLDEWIGDRVGEEHAHTPRVLWHYTNVSGLKGILESSVLWATDTRFLNDASEFEYGLDLMASAVDRASRSVSSRATQRFLSQQFEAGSGTVRWWMERNVSLFVACFCSAGDLLSQWRAYGSGITGTGGFAIGFEPESPRAWVYAAPGGHGLVLRRVLYDRQKQDAVCDGLVQPLAALLDAAADDPRAREAFTQTLIDGAAEVGASCKHPAFAEEQEWRIVYRREAGSSGLDLRFRDGAGFLVPYVELVLPAPTGTRAGKLPVRIVNYGPSRDAARTRRGVELFLKSQPDFADVMLRDSSTPLRL